MNKQVMRDFDTRRIPVERLMALLQTFTLKHSARELADILERAESNQSSYREFLLDLQRGLAAKNDVVMDGRDIGTVILPDAGCKIFLTASAEERAMRRYKELLGKGVEADYDDVLEDLKKRDYDDSHREIAPLKPA